LVYVGLFKKVVVSFLPVGHTHEDIDQFFSRLCVGLRGKDALCWQDLADLIRQSYTTPQGTQPSVDRLTNVANISHWLEPYLNKMEGIMSYRQFIVKRDRPTQKVIVRCRADTVKGDWHGFKDNTIHTEVSFAHFMYVCSWILYFNVSEFIYCQKLLNLGFFFQPAFNDCGCSSCTTQTRPQ
jgi:hypothetical protein